MQQLSSISWGWRGQLSGLSASWHLLLQLCQLVEWEAVMHGFLHRRTLIALRFHAMLPLMTLQGLHDSPVVFRYLSSFYFVWSWHSLCGLSNQSACLLPAGDGTTCSPTSQLQQLNSSYTSRGASTLACSQGQEVPYPAGAPGFVYNPAAPNNDTLGNIQVIMSHHSVLSTFTGAYMLYMTLHL